MPAEYTHQLISEAAYAFLGVSERKRIESLPAYALGAQGADVFYFLAPFRRENAGKVLHGERVYEVFRAFSEQGREAGGEALSYAAGYIAHYAADSIFHPYVYYLVQEFQREEPFRRIRWHSYIESDLDTYFVQKFTQGEVGAYESPFRAGGADLKEIARFMRGVCRRANMRVFSEGAFRRAVAGYLFFCRAVTDRKYRRRAVWERGEGALHFGHALSVLHRRESADPRVLNAEGREWHNLSAPDFVSKEGADALFYRAARESTRLIGLFFRALDTGEELSREDFGKGYLSGIDARLPFVRPSAAPNGGGEA